MRPLPLSVAPADAGVCPSTLGTDTDVCVPDTVSTTGTLALIFVPAAGLWLITVPTGWVDVTSVIL